MKQYQGFTNDQEVFWKVQVKYWKICSTLKRSAMWPLLVRIIIGSEHTSWFWHLWVPLQEHVPDWWQEYILWIYESSIGVQSYILKRTIEDSSKWFKPILAYKPLQAIFLMTKGLLRRTGFADVKYWSRQMTYRVRILSSIWWPEDTVWWHWGRKGTWSPTSLHFWIGGRS